jgi:hypothetical protein
MHKIIYIYFIPALFLVSCGSGGGKTVTRINDSTIQKKLTISFHIDDSAIKISDQFQLYFTKGADTIKPILKGNQLIIPAIPEDTGYSVTFLFQGNSLTFGGITKRMIFPGQNMEWRFGIENRPFKQGRGLISAADIQNDSTTHQLDYLQFDPQEYGDGIQFVKKVY